MKRLVLFDIDGTLVRDDGVCREAFALALKEVFDFERGLKKYDFSGKTDPQITHMVLADGGFSRDEVEEGLPRMWPIYVEALEERANANRVHVLPGIRQLLDQLSEMPEVVLGLLTGNIEPGARIKLGTQNLNDYFVVGAFASDSADRVELPPIAMNRASEKFGQTFEGRDVVIVGDSIFDVRCARPHGVTAIAVSTGVTSYQALADESPDYLFETLEGEEALAAIKGARQ